jgi:CobQ/CobB/MinD/ParA nucleotide binding domain
MKRIYMVNSFKGGVGKSLVCMGLLDYLRQLGEDCLLVDTDTSNPDVYKAYTNVIPCEMVDLDAGDGWIDLINLCDLEEHRQRTVVINGAARSNEGVSKFGDTLKGILPDLKRELVTFWVVNTQRDCVELLKDYMQVMGGLPLHVIRNGYFGGEDKFEIYNNSALRKSVEKNGGKSLTISELAGRVSSVLYSDRKSIETALTEMPLGNRAELLRWRRDCKAMFDKALK